MNRSRTVYSRFMTMTATLMFGAIFCCLIPHTIIDVRPVDSKEKMCLAKNIFFEARGTDIEEMVRIINVTSNRVKASGKSYCKIVYEHAQFSWTMDLIRHNISKLVHNFGDSKAWQEAQFLADYELARGFPDTTGGALYYHNYDVEPRWPFKLTLASNYHKYYKPK